jgi:cobyrinic acid a,c-diamide synthase
MVKGCVSFDPDVKIVGVILNKVAGKRHKKTIVDSIEKYCGLPVLSSVPDLEYDSTLIPGRHLGLVTPSEFASGPELDARLQDIADEYLDIDGLIDVAGSASMLEVPERDLPLKNQLDVKIGYFNDSVFTFYYPENLEALRARGGEVVPFSSLSDNSLPDLDALYIGGGFPETHVEALARNRSMMSSVRDAAERGMPIYAECGGLIYLSNSLICDESRYPMAGLFPVDLKLHSRPAGHGYTLTNIDRANPFFKIGRELKGHEFHYSMPVNGVNKAKTCMKVESGVGLGDQRDGLMHRNTLACYMHIHANGVSDWASSIVSLARSYRSRSDDSRKTGAGGFESGYQKNIDNRAGV